MTRSKPTTEQQTNTHNLILGGLTLKGSVLSLIEYIPSFVVTKTGHRPPPSQEYEQSTAKTFDYFPNCRLPGQIALLYNTFCGHNPTEVGKNTQRNIMWKP